MRCSMSRSITPLPMCTAPGRCPFAHSLSSRTSTSRNFSPASLRRFTSATLVSLTFFFASFTSFRNCGAWAIGKTPSKNDLEMRITRANAPLGLALRSLPPSGFLDEDGSKRSRGFLILRTFALRPFYRALLGKRAHQVHEIPSDFFRRSIAFARHLPLTLANNPKELAVSHLFDGRSVAPVTEFKLHIRSEVTLPVATFAVTHSAIVAKKLARFRQSFRCWRDRILFGGVFRRYFCLCGSRLFLGGIRLSV